MSDKDQATSTQAITELAQETSSDQPDQTNLDTLPQESIVDDTSLAQTLPDVVDGTEQLSKTLPTATTVGFEPSAPSKPRVEMVIHNYTTPFFDITSRIAPNKTIDFTLKNKERTEEEFEQSQDLPLWSTALELLKGLTQFYVEDPINKAAPALANPNFNAFDMLCKLPFSISVNIKPLLTCEKNDDKDATILGLIQVKMNNVDELPEGLLRFVRVQKDMSVGFFNAMTLVIIEGYKQAHPDVPDVTMASIRYDYLGQIPGGLTGENKPKTFVKEDNKISKGQTTTQPDPSDTSTPRRMVDRREEQRRAPVNPVVDPSLREIETRVRFLSRQSGEQYEQIASQLRTVQAQQADIMDQNRDILADNQTLFQIINLLIKTIQAK